jgi:nifR3 family TIM-barrel protein
MAGVADWAFRQVCYSLGAEVAVSHFVPAFGIAGNPGRLLPTVGAKHGDRPFLVQLFGRDPADFRRAARLLTDSLPVAGIDINMGCPANQVVGSTHGSALMREPELAAEIVAATRAGTHLPVSVKLRSGWDSPSAPELARLLESAGASMLAIHGRTREQRYTGTVDLEVIAATRRAVTIPVVGNGDVVSVETARRMLEATGVAGVMVGRGAVGSPWLFAELRAELKGDRQFQESASRHGQAMREYVRLAFEDHGPRAAFLVRKHLVAFSRGSPASARLRRGLARLATQEDVVAWIAELEAARARHADSAAHGSPEEAAQSADQGDGGSRYQAAS